MYSLLDLIQLLYGLTVSFSLYMLVQEDVIHKGKPIDELSDDVQDVLSRQGVIIMSYVLCFIPLVNLFMLKTLFMSNVIDVMAHIDDALERFVTHRVHVSSITAKMTTGILVENEDLAYYKEELIRSDMSDFTTAPFTDKTTMIQLNISLNRLPDVQRLCKRARLTLKHSN